MQYRVLGPLEVWRADRQVALGGPQQKALLAILLLNANRVMSAERLVEYLWGKTPPATARGLLQGCVAQLRRALASPEREQPLLTRGSGYLLRVEPGELDLDRFEELAGTAAGMADLGRRAGKLTEALRLWRGPALDGLGVDTCEAEAARLEERRLSLLEARIETDLRRGAHTGVVAELQGLVRQHPLRERVWGLLIALLYADDRQGDALAAYRQLRDALVRQLGVEPGPVLQELHRQVLAGVEPAELVVGVGQPIPSEPVHQIPAQLPAPVPAFTGREAELAQLDAALRDAADDDAAAVAISAVSGTAGVGKTALAVHWAHRVAGQFPDGQLYLNLRGFDPGGAIVDPAEAVRGFLDALGVGVDQVPADPAAQAALYRTVLADRRVLIVLDNARDVDQVRPLLPGSPRCVVLVTSRNQLPGLIAAEGAQSLSLDLLSRAEARRLFSRRLGAHRVAVEREAVEEIITRCARLPLALAITAARAATGVSLSALAEQLGATEALDAFDIGDSSSDIRAVFSCSYRTLDEPAARLFRLLGGHPGADLGLPAAASLAGLPVRQVRSLLGELTRAHLVAESGRERYEMHDLLRVYAIEQARLQDDEAERSAARHRMLDHYLHTGYAAAMMLSPNRHPIVIPAAQPGVGPEPITDLDQALAWFAAQRSTLLAVIARPPDGFDAHTWQLAWTLTNFLERRGYWSDHEILQHAGLTAARRSGDRRGQAHAHRSLANVYTKLGRMADANEHNLQALTLFEQVGDEVSLAHMHLALAWVAERQQQYPEAIRHAELSLDLHRATGHRPGQAHALNALGYCYGELGDHHRALELCQQARTLFTQLGDRNGEAGTADSLGNLHFQLGQRSQAITCYLDAIAAYRETGDRYNEADTLVNLGDGYESIGEHEPAREVWQQALAILEGLDHPAADTIRGKLRPTPTLRASGL